MSTMDKQNASRARRSFTEEFKADAVAMVLDAWSEFVPFLDYSPEIRRGIYSTNVTKSLNARFRRATRARGHFPSEQAAMKRLYMVVQSLDPTDPTGTGQERWMNRWKPALKTFAITFEGRLFWGLRSQQATCTARPFSPIV